MITKSDYDAFVKESMRLKRQRGISKGFIKWLAEDEAASQRIDRLMVEGQTISEWLEHYRATEGAKMNLAATIANAIFTYGPSLVGAIASIWQEKEHGALTIEQAEARIKDVIDFAEKQKKLDEEAVRDAIGK